MKNLIKACILLLSVTFYSCSGVSVSTSDDFQIAESKIYDVTESAREHNFPLKVTGEPE